MENSEELISPRLGLKNAGRDAVRLALNSRSVVKLLVFALKYWLIHKNYLQASHVQLRYKANRSNLGILSSIINLKWISEILLDSEDS